MIHQKSMIIFGEYVQFYNKYKNIVTFSGKLYEMNQKIHNFIEYFIKMKP